MKKHRLRTIVFALILLISIVQIGRKLYEGAVRERVYAEAAQLAGLTAAEHLAGPAASPSPEEQPTPEEVRALAAIDLAALRTVNPDVAGWIQIPGTELSYPVLQGEDDRYYLGHTWKGERNSGGSIFLEAACSADFSDLHTIVYGHRMLNDSMFGTLKHYQDPVFWQEHPSVYVALDGKVYRYDVFAAREASVKGIVYRLDLKESGLAEEFLQDCLDNSILDTGIVPEAGERFLTLSTCTARGGRAERWVVHTVLRGSWTSE